MTSPSEPRTPLSQQAAFDPKLAMQIAGAALAGLLAISIALSAADVPMLVTATAGQLGFGATAVWLVRVRGGSLATLGLRRPAVRFIVAGVLIGSALWYPSLRLTLVIHPPGDSRPLEQLVGQTELAATLVAVGLVPAVCEELVHRGLLARALATRMPATLAIVSSAVLFSAYHMSLVQAVPSFVLGLALAYLALRADSIIPTMIAHALNNTIAVVMSRDAVPAIGAWLGGHPNATLLGASTVVCAGLGLAARSAP